MSFPCYLAMTAAEFSSQQTLPPHIAWMACHFSSYATGLSNFPESLPAGSMLILNDRTPVQGHDPQEIARQLEQFVAQYNPESILLDFQRPNVSETAQIAAAITQSLPCPVGVTEHYAGNLECPVFLSPPCLHVPLKKHLLPWSGREIWLEAALENQRITVTPEGSQVEVTPFQVLSEPFFEESKLHCSYHLDIHKDSAVFSMTRDFQCLTKLLEEAEKLGVTKAVGLYQQLKDFPIS